MTTYDWLETLDEPTLEDLEAIEKWLDSIEF